MTGIEIFIVVVLVACLFWGYSKGIIIQLGSLLSFAIAIAVCQIFGDAFTSVIEAIMGGPEQVSNPANSAMSRFMASSVAHVILFLIVWLGVWLIARAMKLVVRTARLGFIDRMAGALFMVLKGALIMSFIISFARWAAPASALAGKDSVIIDSVGDVAPMLLGFIEPYIS